jgi:galactokinase
VAGAVADAFVRLTGQPPQGVWSAPGRVNLIGEHTDYNDGFVLPFAIGLRASVAVRLRDDGVVRLRSLQKNDEWAGALDDVAPGRVEGWAGYVVGVAWALAQSGMDVTGFDLVVDSDVPVGAGLSSSAAVEAAVAVALDDLLGLGADRVTLALACRRAENDVVGAVTGVMDQMAALHARRRHAMLLDCRSLVVEQVPFDPAGSDLAVVVVDTKVSHGNASGAYADRRRSCESAARALGVRSLRDASLDDVAGLADDELRRRARHVVTENVRVLRIAGHLRAGDIALVGSLLDESHASMRDDFQISCPELEVAVASMREGGASGARLTGAGFGGCALALVPAAEVAAAERAVRDAFARRGYRQPASFVVAAADGACRLQ